MVNNIDSPSIILCDTETTGLLKPSIVSLNKQPRIIEIGLIKTDGEKILGEISQLIKPDILITEKITKINGITNDMVSTSPTFEEFLPELISFFEGAVAFIAHNAPFDKGMIDVELKRLNVNNFPFPELIICAVQEYKHLFGRRLKLKETYEFFFNEELKQTHRAIDDIKILYQILKKDGFFDTIKDTYRI